MIYKIQTMPPDTDDWITTARSFDDRAAADEAAERLVSKMTAEFGEDEFSVRVIEEKNDD